MQVESMRWSCIAVSRGRKIEVDVVSNVNTFSLLGPVAPTNFGASHEWLTADKGVGGKDKITDIIQRSLQKFMGCETSGALKYLDGEMVSIVCNVPLSPSITMSLIASSKANLPNLRRLFVEARTDAEESAYSRTAVSLAPYTAIYWY